MTESIAVVRSAFEHVRAGDVESMIAITSPDVEFSTFLTEVEGGSYRGHDGVRAWQADLRSSFAHYEPDPARFEDYGDLVLTTGTIHFRGTESGAPVHQPFANVMAVAGGEIRRWRTYRSRGEAIAAHDLSDREPIAVAEARVVD